jgi:hypothetical protein
VGIAYRFCLYVLVVNGHPAVESRVSEALVLSDQVAHV